MIILSRTLPLVFRLLTFALSLLLVPAAPGAQPQASRRQIEGLKARADKGEAAAQFEVATHYEALEKAWIGKLPPKEAQAAAAALYQKAAEQNFLGAATKLGEMHRDGRATLFSDNKMALRWFRHDAELGHVPGMHLLATNLLKSQQRADWQEGMTWLHKVIEREPENADAIYLLGGMYSSSLLGPPDRAKGLVYYEKALALGHTGAVRFIEKHRAEAKAEVEGSGFLATLPMSLQEAVKQFQAPKDYFSSKERDQAIAAFAQIVSDLGRKESIPQAEQCRIVIEALRPLMVGFGASSYALLEAIPVSLYPDAMKRAALPERFRAAYEEDKRKEARRVEQIQQLAAASAPAPVSSNVNLPVREIGQRVGDGVVYWVDYSGQHGLILELNELKRQEAPDAHRPTTFNADGLTAWYVPTIDEWKLLQPQRQRVEQALARERGTPLGSDYYWSSSTVLYQTAPRDGFAHRYGYNSNSGDELRLQAKTDYASVRRVRQF